MKMKRASLSFDTMKKGKQEFRLFEVNKFFDRLEIRKFIKIIDWYYPDLLLLFLSQVDKCINSRKFSNLLEGNFSKWF